MPERSQRFAFLSAFPPYRGGIAQFSTALVQELRKTHPVSAFTFKRQYPSLLFPGSSQFDPKAADPIGAERVLDSIGPFSWKRTAERMLATGPDVSVLRYWMPFFAPALGTVAGRLRAKGSKVISIVDNAVPHEPRFFDKPFTRWFFRRNDGLIALTEAVRNDILSLQPDARVTVLPHPLYDHFGVQMDRREARKQLGLPPDARVLLFFGLIREYKGLDRLLRAFNALDQRYHLVIAGEAYGSFEPYKRLIEAGPFAANVHVHNGYIPDTQVAKFFGAADALVLPYSSGTQSGVTAMAYHFGLPVIATGVGGLKEAVHHERTGLVTAPTDETLRAAISTLFEEGREVRFRSGIAALREELSWARFADGLVRFSGSL